MQEKHRKHIISYLNQNFIKTVHNFQKTVQWLNDLDLKVHINVTRLGNNSLNSKALKDFPQGHNTRAQTKVCVVLRILSSRKKFFCLVTDQGLPKYPFQYGCLVVEGNSKLLDEIVPGRQMVVKEPYLASEFGQYIKVLITRQQNISIGGDKYFVQPKLVKQSGNQLFKANSFYQALLTYELCLISLTSIEQFRERAILYSNSAACLYQIYLYQSSMEYANISIQIDNTYPKSYIRKINCLLEQSKFKDVPKCLLNVYHKVDANQIERLNKKYTNFVQNSYGVYDWVQIFTKGPTSKAKQFGNFISDKIVIQSPDKQYPVLIAKQDITQGQLIMVTKPLVYFKAANAFIKQFVKVSEEIFHYVTLQRNFYLNLKKIPCLCHPNQPTNQSVPLNQQELLKKMERSLFMERYLEQISGQVGYGVWKDMLLFKQQCQPNCTFVHLKTAFVANAWRQIKKGQTLSVDFFAQTEAPKRRQIIDDKFGFLCQCQSCVGKKWPSKYFGNIEGLYKLVDSMKTNKLKKEMIWHVLCQRKMYGDYSIENHYIETMEKYLNLVNISIAWEDLLNILKILRGQQNKQVHSRLYATVLNGFMKFLSLDKEGAEKLIKILQ